MWVKAWDYKNVLYVRFGATVGEELPSSGRDFTCDIRRIDRLAETVWKMNEIEVFFGSKVRLNWKSCAHGGFGKSFCR